MKMNPVVHFELPFEDRERVAKFYQKAFGWQSQMFGPEMGNYVVATTTEVDEQTHMPKQPGRINGGFFKKSETRNTPSIVIAVDDIQDAMNKVREAGGQISGGSKPGEPDEIPGIGLYIAFVDTEGNKIALLQPKPIMEVSAK